MEENSHLSLALDPDFCRCLLNFGKIGGRHDPVPKVEHGGDLQGMAGQSIQEIDGLEIMNPAASGEVYFGGDEDQDRKPTAGNRGKNRLDCLGDPRRLLGSNMIFNASLIAQDFPLESHPKIKKGVWIARCHPFSNLLPQSVQDTNNRCGVPVPTLGQGKTINKFLVHYQEKHLRTGIRTSEMEEGLLFLPDHLTPDFMSKMSKDQPIPVDHFYVSNGIFLNSLRIAAHIRHHSTFEIPIPRPRSPQYELPDPRMEPNSFCEAVAQTWVVPLANKQAFELLV